MLAAASSKLSNVRSAAEKAVTALVQKMSVYAVPEVLDHLFKVIYPIPCLVFFLLSHSYFILSFL